MNNFGKFLIIFILVILAIVLFPTVRWGVDNIDTTGFMPFLAGMTAFLPYAFIAVIVYVVLKK